MTINEADRIPIQHQPAQPAPARTRIANLILDFILGIFGLDIVKYTRIYVVILKAGNDPVADEANIKNKYHSAKRIYKEAVNIELILEGIHIVGDPSPREALKITCNIDSWGTDLSLAGSYFEWLSLRFWDSRLSRTIGLGAPITVFVVHRIQPERFKGCSMGPLTDYVLIEGEDPICLAHELGHSCALILPMHVQEEDNLMSPTCGGTKLTAYQRGIVRSSRHVSYV